MGQLKTKEIRKFSDLLYQYKRRFPKENAYQNIALLVNSIQSIFKIFFVDDDGNKGGVEFDSENSSFKVIKGKTDYFVKVVSKEGGNMPVTKFAQILLADWITINEALTNKLLATKSPPKIDVNTSNSFYDSGVNAEMCIFFDARIEIKEWLTPAMQYNFFIQKSIEQGNNYRHISNCYLNGINNKKNKCNLPDRKNFRIMFLKHSDAEIKNRLENLEKGEKDEKANNLKNVIIAHIITGVPLAIIPKDKFQSIIDSISLAYLSVDEIAYLKDVKNIENLDFTIYKNITKKDKPQYTEIWSGSTAGNILRYNPEYSTNEINADKRKWKNNLEIGTKIFEHLFKQKKFKDINRRDFSNNERKDLGDDSEMMCVHDNSYCAIHFLNEAKKSSLLNV